MPRYLPMLRSYNNDIISLDQEEPTQDVVRPLTLTSKKGKTQKNLYEPAHPFQSNIQTADE